MMSERRPLTISLSTTVEKLKLFLNSERSQQINFAGGVFSNPVNSVVPPAKSDRINMIDRIGWIQWEGRKMTTKIYCRCNSGHYFIGPCCPLDGWSSPESLQLSQAAAEMIASGKVTTLNTLRTWGVSDQALKRAIAIEFGSDQSTFDAISPEGYFVDGSWIKQSDFDVKFR